MPQFASESVQTHSIDTVELNPVMVWTDGLQTAGSRCGAKKSGQSGQASIHRERDTAAQKSAAKTPPKRAMPGKELKT